MSTASIAPPRRLPTRYRIIVRPEDLARATRGDAAELDEQEVDR